MKTLVERLREEADDTHKNWYRVASEEQREQCRALTLEAADRVAELEALLAARPPYYCQNCRCERCGNTFAVEREAK
jgi:hypothetical protein